LVLLPVQLRRLGVGRRLVAVPLAGVFAIDALGSSDWWPGAAGTALAIVATLIAALLIAAWSTLTPASRRHRLLAVTAMVALVAAVLGYPTERSYFRHRYEPSLAPAADSPGFRDSPQWHRIQSWARDRHRATIGVVGPPGAFGQYLFSDSELTNRVDYIGEPGADGAYRPISDCAIWRRAVNEEGLDFVVVTPATAIGPAATPRESLWMENEPNAEPVLRASPAAIYRITGPLDPGACRRLNLPPVLAVPGGGVAIPPGPSSSP
jgi:hypothetical protein